MVKKVIGLLLVICLVTGMMPMMAEETVRAETQCLSDEAQCQQMYKGSNINAQNYGNSYPYWSSPIESYLVPMSDGGVIRVQAGGETEGLLVEYYDASHKVQTSRTKLIAEELPIFGGFYAASDGYYVLTGQENPSEDAEVEVYRITKYDTDWNRIASDGLKDCNTTIPFSAGCARMEAYGGYLLIRTSHQMYRSADGLKHQANVTIQLDTRTVKITDSFTRVMNSSVGYVSHSFNQFLHIEDGHIVAVDHGDAYPRSVVLIKYPSDVSFGKFVTSDCSAIDVMEFPGEIGANDTGASVGAFEISDSSYLIAGNSGIKGETIGETHNIFVAAVDKETDKVTTNWLTDYAEGDGTTSTPHMVRLSDDCFVVLWSRGDSVYYTAVNGQGQKSDIYSMKGELSDCAPVIVGDNITWYTWKDETISFYDINVAELSFNNKTVVEAGHRYEFLQAKDGIASLRCSVCGEEKQVATYTSYNVWWNEENGSGSYSSICSSTYKVGDNLYFLLKGIGFASSAELDREWTVEISDDSKAGCTMDYSNENGGGGHFTMLSPGEVIVSFFPRYNPDAKKTYKLTISSDPVTGIEISPSSMTLTEGETRQLEVNVQPVTADQSVTFSSSDESVATVSGQGVVTAVKAGKTTVTATAADGTHSAACTVTVSAHTHNMIYHEGFAATCTEAGQKAYYECQKCHKYYSDQTGDQEITNLEIQALGHSFTDYQFNEGSASCTEDGTETAKCDRCDVTDTKTAEGTKLGHSWNVVIDRPATEEQTGLKHEECTVCGVKGEETEIPMLDHTHVMTWHEGMEATCTEAGKKAHYECSKCNKFYSDETGNLEITDLEIPALGHSFNDYRFDEGSASCTKDGTETAKCSRCDATDTRTAEGTKLPHQLSEWVTVNPTCTEDGSRSRSCANCDYIESEKIESPGHSWNKWIRDKEPDCTTEGSESRICSVCEVTESRVVNAIGHKWSAVMEWAEDYSSVEVTATCENDPAHVERIEDATITVQDTSTCAEAGVITYIGTVTLPDGATFTDIKTAEGIALGHSFSYYVLNGDGTETAKCDRCIESYTRKSKIQITDKTDANVTVNVGGLDLNQIVDNLSEHNVEVILHQETASEKNVTSLKEKVDAGYEAVNIYEIRLLLRVDGENNVEITEGFGSICLNLSAGKGSAGKKVIVYQLHGNEIITHKDLTADAEGNVKLEIDKLSSFLVAVEKQEQMSSDNNNNNNGNNNNNKGSEGKKPEPISEGTVIVAPETGEDAHWILWMTVYMIGGVVCVTLASTRRKQK